MKEVQLYRREGNGRWGTDVEVPHIALVDDEDYDFVIGFHKHWRLHSQGYAVCTKRIAGKSVPILMHRLVINNLGELHTDHIDHNRLNNQKVNLTACTQQDNNRNLPFKGYGPYKGRWRAWERYTSRWLGTYDTEEEARKVADDACLDLC